ncbi:MAG: hypothetical protein JWP87_3997, partial [Labilithrix sp.]|nr:hypothetical protein [Labilithrix sp.]
SDEIDGARTFFVAGDVIGAVGLLTLGAATAAYFLGRGDGVARASARGIEIRF